VRNYEFLFASFAVVWIGIAAYVGFVAARLAKVADRIDKLEQAVAARERS
jgi:CcmD family protein